jgi:RNA polymerase primary sigma factor
MFWLTRRDPEMSDQLRAEATPYLNEVQNEPILTREEEKTLFKQLEAGDPAAHEKIVRANLRFVVKIAYEFVERGVPLPDLIQEGNIGLLEVIPKFDWRKGFRFSTYAAFWIRQAIQMAIRRQNGMIRLPIRKSRMLGRLSEEVCQFSLEHGREPTADELAPRLKLSVKDTEQLMGMREGVLSLDARSDENAPTLLDTVAEPEAKSPRTAAEQKQMRSKVGRVMDYLGERERRVVRLRFGFVNGRALSLRRTSKVIGLSQEGVRRIEQRALGKLRRPGLRRMVAGLV